VASKRRARSGRPAGAGDVEQLRARVAELEAQLAAKGAPARPTARGAGDVKREIAVQTFATSGNRKLAAKAAGVRPEQVSRWFADEDLRKRALELVNAGMEPARLAWAALVIASIERMAELVQSRDETIAERAARTVLDRHKEFAPHVVQHDASGLTREQLRERFDAAMAKLDGKETSPG
jgi:hypothetical protein